MDKTFFGRPVSDAEIDEIGNYKKKTSATGKLKSVKLWVTAWSLAMITFIVATNRTDFLIVAQILCGVPLAYIGANIAQKAIAQKSPPFTTGHAYCDGGDLSQSQID